MSYAAKFFVKSTEVEHTIILDQKTQKEAAKYFLFNQLDPIQVKGKTDLIQIFQPISRKKNAHKILRSLTPRFFFFSLHRYSLLYFIFSYSILFINLLFSAYRHITFGRELELKQMQNLFLKLQSAGNGCVVMIEADAGYGKSNFIFLSFLYGCLLTLSFRYNCLHKFPRALFPFAC
jgi:hypothetical protein